MNTEDKGKLFARAATKESPCLLSNLKKWPQRSFVVINFYEKEEVKMATKFHAGYLKNGDSSEKRKWKAKESKVWAGVND